MAEATTATLEEDDLVTFSAFLENRPPSQHLTKIKNLFVQTRAPMGDESLTLATPDLQLHCSSDQCNGLRFFRYSDGDRSVHKGTAFTYLTYLCSNCKNRLKIFSLYARLDDSTTNSSNGSGLKFGETPAFGPATPNRLLKLFEATAISSSKAASARTTISASEPLSTTGAWSRTTKIASSMR